MPFLRAALLKKNLEKALEPEQPPVIIEEQIQAEEPEEEFEPEKIEALQLIIDERTEEAEIEIQEAPQPVVVLEVEAVETVVEEAEEVDEEEVAVNTLEEVEENADEIEGLDEAVHVPEGDGSGVDVLEIQEEKPPEQEAGSKGTAEEIPEEVEVEEIEEQEPEPVVEEEPGFDENSLLGETPEPEPEPTSHKDYSGSHLDYDFTSGERYVDKVSTKTEFDKMLDELAAISKDLLAWQTEKFARQYTEKFQDGEESSVADARKCEAFLGGYITNAAMQLYDLGYRDIAIKQLEQAISVLQARMKLEDETSAIKSRVEEQNDTVDLSDILGLFGDG